MADISPIGIHQTEGGLIFICYPGGHSLSSKKKKKSLCKFYCQGYRGKAPKDAEEATGANLTADKLSGSSCALRLTWH